MNRFGMKFVYFGSSHFSHTVLEELYKKGFVPGLVVSKPDRPKGRGLKVISTEVSKFATDKKIPLIRPESLKEASVKERLTKEKADLFIIADYGKIIPNALLTIPNIQPLCVHPSMLPLCRGPAPIEYAILEGKLESGATIFVVNERVDAGDIILQKKALIDREDDFFSLSRRLAVLGSELLIKVINNMLKPQNESKATLTHKLKKGDGLIAWKHPAEKIRNLVRATLGWPSAYTYHGDLMVKLVRVDLVDDVSADKPGTIVRLQKDGIYVATGQGILKIKKLKPQGKKEMDAWAFVCGHRVKVGDKFL